MIIALRAAVALCEALAELEALGELLAGLLGAGLRHRFLEFLDDHPPD
jgi:hypothetical protein